MPLPQRSPQRNSVTNSPLDTLYSGPCFLFLSPLSTLRNSFVCLLAYFLLAYPTRLWALLGWVPGLPKSLFLPPLCLEEVWQLFFLLPPGSGDDLIPRPRASPIQEMKPKPAFLWNWEGHPGQIQVRHQLQTGQKNVLPWMDSPGQLTIVRAKLPGWGTLAM